MTETMAGPTSTPGPGAFASAAADPGGNASGTPEQRIAWLQARLDAVAEKSDDTFTSLLLSQVSDRFSRRIAGILPFIPFFDSGGPGRGDGNNMLPLVLALTLSDDGDQDIRRALPLFLLSGSGGPGMGGQKNGLPLALALTLCDDGGGGGGPSGGGAGGPDSLIKNLEKKFDGLREDLKQVRETRDEVSSQERDDGGGAGGLDTLIESLEPMFDSFREDLEKMKEDQKEAGGLDTLIESLEPMFDSFREDFEKMKEDQKEVSDLAKAIGEKVDNLTQEKNP